MPRKSRNKTVSDALKDLRKRWKQISKTRQIRISKALESCKKVTPPKNSFYNSNKSKKSLYEIFKESDEECFECPHCGEYNDFSEYIEYNEEFPTYCDECGLRMDIFHLIEYFGDWAITLYGIEYLGKTYQIAHERLNDADWISHMAEKNWVFLDDFAKALTYARMFFYPDQFLPPYQKYLRSDQWQLTKQKALDYYGNSCVLCGTNSEINVHHRSYDRLGKEEINKDLIVLCKKCHSKFHNKD